MEMADGLTVGTYQNSVAISPGMGAIGDEAGEGQG